MHAGPLIGEEKNPRRGRFEGGHRMFAFQLDITDLRTFRSRLWPERGLALLERQRHEFVLIVEGVDQTAIGWSRRQELLGPSVWRHQDDDGPKQSNDGEVQPDLAQAAISSAASLKGPFGIIDPQSSALRTSK